MSERIKVYRIVETKIEIKDKKDWWDVSDKDWHDSSFTMGDMKKILKEELLSFKKSEREDK